MPDELFLIDGNSLAYRAFFALPESIATSTGVPTNAIFGFASMLVKILTDYGPKATVVVWDAGYTGRKELYTEYKAQRSTRPDLLKEQWPHLAPLVEAFGYRNLKMDGFEADDVIASIAERARHQEPPIPVMVVTGDRDAYQLVDDGVVRIMTTSRGITDTRVYDRDGVIDRYGIPPELVPDFIGLKGDTSDNIPGVPGIGDKTAAELLQRFGSLENVLDSIDEISGAKRKQNLTEHADAARLSKQLATAKRDIPLEIDLADFVAAEPDRSQLRDVFRQFELREPLRRLEEALGSADAAAPGARRGAGAHAPRSGRPASRSSTGACPATAGRRSRCARPRPPRGRCSPPRRAGATASTRDRPRCSAGECAEPRAARADARPAPGDRPRRQVARRGARDDRPRHRGRRLPARAGPPRLPVPRAVRGARARHRAVGRTTRPPATRVLVHALADWQREEIRGRGLDRPVRATSSCRWSRSCARWSRPG